MMRIRKIRWPYTYTLALIAIFFTACETRVPSVFDISSDNPCIVPDYTSITIPANIAPLNFMYADPAVTDAVTVYICDGDSVVLGGRTLRWNERRWHEFVKKCVGKTILVESFVCLDNAGKATWTKLRDYTIDVAAEPVDPYITYRLISPSYMTYEELTLNQRCLENFDESVIYSNMLVQTSGQCVNCHTCRNNNPDSLQFHARQEKGGTMMALNGDVRKINLKTDSTLSAGVYPAWHPTHNYIAYSVNNTGQMFHTRDLEKIEVMDMESDLILYDIDRNEVTIVENDSLEWECFPCWSPDGHWLYYVSAHFEGTDSIAPDREIISHYQDFHYNLYRKSFDPDTRHFGASELVYDAAAEGKSVTLPRVSPDGRWLLATIGDYGVFHIWHRSADLFMIDLESGQGHLLCEVNSPDTESYHNWSTNGRWILFSSRRDDGSFTRLYLSYFDAEGMGRKPFVIPQKDPSIYAQLLRSYNVPEFMTGPVTIRPQRFARAMDAPAQQVTWHSAY